MAWSEITGNITSLEAVFDSASPLTPDTKSHIKKIGENNVKSGCRVVETSSTSGQIEGGTIRGKTDFIEPSGSYFTPIEPEARCNLGPLDRREKFTLLFDKEVIFQRSEDFTIISKVPKGSELSSLKYDVRIGDFDNSKPGEEVAVRLPDGAIKVFARDN